MIKTVYRTTVDGELHQKVNVEVETNSQEEAISQARILESNYPVYCKIYENKLDGEDIVSSRIFYDGTPE